MKEIMAVDTDEPEARRIIADIDAIFKKIEDVNARIERNQTEIDRLKKETQTILADLKVTA